MGWFMGQLIHKDGHWGVSLARRSTDPWEYNYLLTHGVKLLINGDDHLSLKTGQMGFGDDAIDSWDGDISPWVDGAVVSGEWIYGGMIHGDNQ